MPSEARCLASPVLACTDQAGERMLVLEGSAPASSENTSSAPLTLEAMRLLEGTRSGVGCPPLPFSVLPGASLLSVPGPRWTAVLLTWWDSTISGLAARKPRRLWFP